MRQVMFVLLATAVTTFASAETLQKSERQAQSAEPQQKGDCRVINTSKSNLRQGFTIDEKGVKREAPQQECDKQQEPSRAASAK